MSLVLNPVGLTTVNIMPGAMDVDRIGLPATALDGPTYLGSLVESDTPCSREGWAQSQPWTMNVLSYAPTQADTHQARSEASASASRDHSASRFNLLSCVIRFILLDHRQCTLSSLRESVNTPQVWCQPAWMSTFELIMNTFLTLGIRPHL